MKPSKELLDRIAKRTHALATQMIFQANHRADKEKGDPKIGGHVSASASSLHILGALHLVVKTGFDHIANKPHASPTDHSYNYLLDLFLRPDLSRLSLAECNTAMTGLRKYSKNGEPVFQSYHSIYDPDHHNFFPSGTVGIPPVNAGYLALAYRYAREHGYEVPDAHFWAISGDSEFREGSMFEAIPDFAEREIGNLTWILDYNRQSLDGHRITNTKTMGGTDAQRIAKTMEANGWEVIQVQHGAKRLGLFKKPGGDLFQQFIEKELADYDLQALLLLADGKRLKEALLKEQPTLKKFLSGVSEQELFEGFRDFGGHDFDQLIAAMEQSKKSQRRPTLIIAHTLKGWGLKMAASPGNHSALLDEDEMEQILKAEGLSKDTPFARFATNTPEGQFLTKRGEQIYQDIRSEFDLKAKNQQRFSQIAEQLPEQLDINLKMASYPHTQWMLGQLTAKLTRIANAKTLPAHEEVWRPAAEMFVSMAPDVGTSTNLNPAMDGKIFGATQVEDVEAELGVKDEKTPDLVPGEEVSDRFIRFEIAEANVMSCVGSFGRVRDTLGIPLMPLMTVYDFFIKRALDQYFYNLYWKSSFICVGTPSGVTLSPEGAQHGWKSDFQIPNQITWEPFFCVELDWIFCDALKRHFSGDNVGRSGVLIRGVTRGAEQKDLMRLLRRAKRYKIDPNCSIHPEAYPLAGAVAESSVAAVEDTQILHNLRSEVLKGGYWLIDYRGYQGYSPGDNVVNIFAMGSPTTEAIKASEQLLAQGVYANVIVVTSSDLLCGIQADQEQYQWLTQGLGLDLQMNLNGSITSSSGLVILNANQVPVVSVHDGEAGLLDNLGSILGTRQISLAVRRHSKCGRPIEIYHFHGIDAEAIHEASLKALEEVTKVQVQLINRPKVI